MKLIETGEEVLTPAHLTEIEPFIKGLGGSYFSASDHTFTGYLDSEATVKAIEDYLARIPEVSLIGIPQLPKNDPAMGLVRATRHYKALRSTARDYQIAQVPSSSEGVRHNVAVISGLAITQQSRQQELAWELMKFIAGDSSEQAMDFLVSNTLENYRPSYRTEPTAKDTDLKQWMKHEAPDASPASMIMSDSQMGYNYKNFNPYLGSLKEEGIQQTLHMWAQQIDSWTFVAE